MFKKFFNQTRKPVGFGGRLMLSMMNKGHTNISLWGLDQLSSIHPHSIVDIGCGGGANLSRLLKKYKQAKVLGIDYSMESVNASSNFNEEAIIEGRLDVIQGDVLHLPISDESYDIATAFETVYFWPGPVDSFKEVYRILKHEGEFMIVNEVSCRDRRSKKWEEIIDGMVIYNIDELQGFLKEVGFEIVHANVDQNKLCVIAKKR